MLDKDIREPLFDYLDERYGKVRIFEEKVIHGSRADVLAITDSCIIGLEIKSDNDTYTRLSSQIKDYESFCDLCYVVVGQSHIQVEKHVPDYWGIIVVTPENVIVDRDAAVNPHVKINNQLEILWRKELLNIQLKEGLPKLSNYKRKDIYKRLIESCGEPTVKADITEQLFERDYTVYDMIDASTTENKRYVKTKKGVKVKRKRRKKIDYGDRSRAHVTNYIGKRNK